MPAMPEEEDAMPAAQPKKTNLWIGIGLGCLAVALLLAGGCVAALYYVGSIPGKMDKKFTEKAEKDSERMRREFEEEKEKMLKGGSGKVQLNIPEGTPPEVRNAMIKAVEKNIGRKLKEGEVGVFPAESGPFPSGQ